MKLEGLRTFAVQLAAEFKPEGISPQVYYFFNGIWHNLANESPCTEQQSHSLSRAKLERIAYHAPSNPDAWFYLETGDCAVQLTFPQSPQLATRRRNRDRLLKIQASATNAYKVAHNPLTHLLARDAFRERLAAAIDDVEKPNPTSSDMQDRGAPRTLAVMALDIDHFKQVNDTWGHLYGDQVLKTFGRRLERLAEAIRTRGTGSPAVYLGHPSGEEFLVLVQANVAREQFVEWANEFRRGIADDVLPTDAEWEWLTTTDGLTSLAPPPLQERATTASIGLALLGRTSANDSKVEPIASLLDRADTALYRAKSAGRNQVISFDEILSTCGRVLEHDSTTGVVAIDIGSNVGVSVGQEFKVFSPTFTGSTKFHLHDGRTKRTLGTYPRVESARIVVFNTQPEISFAFVAESERHKTLETASHLEAIPAGSIGHLMPSSSKYFTALRPSSERNAISDMQEYVKSTAAQRGHPFAVVVRFTREAEYLRKYGSVALNQALAQLFREAQVAFHAAKYVEVLDRGSICLVGHKSAYKEAQVAEFVDKMAAELPELGVFAGVFCEADHTKAQGKDKEPLDGASAIEFARFAAADAGRSPDSRVRHFSYATANAVLQALRESQAFEVAYADFERLRTLRVESAQLFNVGGLIAGAIGLRQQALELYAAAMSKDPANTIYKSNYATAAYRLGEIEPGLRVLNGLAPDDVDRLRELHPFGYFNYARLLAKARSLNLESFDKGRFLRIADAALSLSEFQNSPESPLIRETLQSLTTN